MLIAGVLCLCAALVATVIGIRTLSRPRSGELAEQVRRVVAPTQLAAAIMLAAGGAVALAADPHPALLVLIVCVLGAVGTVAAGSWQGARFAVAQFAQQPACAGSCAACTLSCH